ncbi:MAG: hypothetical protein P8184_15795 [Calditrichia bacterium]
MKIAVSSTDDHLFAQISKNLEQSRFILILNSNNLKEYKSILNPYCGTKTDPCKWLVNLLTDQQIDVLVAGKCHQDVMEYLKRTGIVIYSNLTGSVLNTVTKIKNYELSHAI